MLEFASGTGEHVVHFAEAAAVASPGLPSDPNEQQRASVDDWARTLGLANVRPALPIDASAGAWPVAQADAILCINNDPRLGI